MKQFEAKLKELLMSDGDGPSHDVAGALIGAAIAVMVKEGRDPRGIYDVVDGALRIFGVMLAPVGQWCGSCDRNTERDDLGFCRSCASPGPN